MNIRPNSKNKPKNIKSKKKNTHPFSNPKPPHRNSSPWKQLLFEIQNLTHKIQRLSNNKNNKISPSPPSIQTHSYLLNTQPVKGHISQREEYPVNTLGEFIATENNERKGSCRGGQGQCPSLYYKLMKDYEEMVQKNKALGKEKENLEKRLYFESKEKRQLRWKLEKQQRQNANSFNLSELLRQNNISTFTARQEKENRKSRSVLNRQNKKDESEMKLQWEMNLETQRTQREEEKENERRQLREYVRAYSQEKDKIRKEYLKKEMKNIARKLKGIKKS